MDMNIKVTARKSESQTEEYTLWDNKVTITTLSPEIDLDEVIDLADDNGGILQSQTPLVFMFYECGQRWWSVEVDNFEHHLKRM